MAAFSRKSLSVFHIHYCLRVDRSQLFQLFQTISRRRILCLYPKARFPDYTVSAQERALPLRELSTPDDRHIIERRLKSLECFFSGSN